MNDTALKLCTTAVWSDFAVTESGLQRGAFPCSLVKFAKPRYDYGFRGRNV
jgi:hypothetical protein